MEGLRPICPLRERRCKIEEETRDEILNGRFRKEE
jgi:hypothetical protein